ncbi:uncharacterized protein PHALS_13657 [Plasmopara halstedii]|uniref:Uncharacterized protein n=1 Tax=Plasmopara halstedii TaxID=4781 RepID=A0A0P1ARE6_PLAHL|nr:uncharacterized protein PHALS_13657 [Plasmopara halstedii]CEG43462.1 hypothetical protein PHALS_13657 [Plasmopara halstedii]|eukprot:XP_024579831.1 hypothetical protein PHALS_13657 [Plasmopara halstedii]
MHHSTKSLILLSKHFSKRFEIVIPAKTVKFEKCLQIDFRHACPRHNVKLQEQEHAQYIRDEKSDIVENLLQE